MGLDYVQPIYYAVSHMEIHVINGKVLQPRCAKCMDYLPTTLFVNKRQR